MWKTLALGVAAALIAAVLYQLVVAKLVNKFEEAFEE
jgi:hypothetical protein